MPKGKAFLFCLAGAMSKGKAFSFCLLSVMAIYFSMFIAGIAKSDLSIIPVGPCLGAVGALAGMYITGSIANNGVKGANFNPEMYRLENPEGKSD